jgi:DNA repair exonuclease SbcCD ATPase subunit
MQPSITLESAMDSATLRAIVGKTDEALASIDIQITTLQARITESRERLDTLHVQSLEAAHQVSEAGSQVQELQARIKHAQVAAAVAAGTAAEGSTHANVEALQNELGEAEQAQAEARKKQTRQDATIRKEQAIIQKDLAVEQELDSLRLTRQQLEQTREEAHAALGQAVYHEIENELADLAEIEQNVEELLIETRADRRFLQADLGSRLSEWPDLSKDAQLRLGVQVEAEETATTRVINALLAYIEELKDGTDIVGTNSISKVRVSGLLALPEAVIRNLLGVTPQRESTLRDLDNRRHDLLGWRRDHERERMERLEQRRQNSIRWGS